MSAVANVSTLAGLVGLTLLVACGSSTPGPGNGASGVGNLAGQSAFTGDAGKAGAGGVPATGGAGGAADGGAADTGPGGQGGDSACTAYAMARCTRYQACIPWYFSILYSSFADCKQVTLATCSAELSAPGTSRTSESVASCAADTAAQSCADWRGKLPASCGVPGSLVVDAGCEYDSQCESAFCDVAAGSWCGVCKARDIEGAACDAGQASCVRGLRCAFGCATGDTCAATDKQFRCAVPKAQGIACDNITECQATLTCLAGICTTGAALGAACDPSVNANCEGSADLACVSGSSGATCVKSSYVGANAACNLTTSQQCSGLGTCAGTDGRYTQNGPGTCTPPGGPGDACSSDKLCRQPALCFGGVCTSPVDPATCH